MPFQLEKTQSFYKKKMHLEFIHAWDFFPVSVYSANEITSLFSKYNQFNALYMSVHKKTF